MKSPKAVGRLFVILAVIASPGLGLAAPFDGSAPLLCAVSTVVECESSGQCERRTLEDTNMPAFVRVNVGERTVSAAGANGTPAEIRSTARLDGRLILQGGEHGRGWSATIDEDTGKMTVAVVDHDAGFVIFGACTTP